jgi:hypothetical protein
MTGTTKPKRSRFLAVLLIVDLGLGVLFGGLAVASASATEGDGIAEVMPTAEPTIGPTAEPVARQASRTPRVNSDGSMTIQWLDTVRSETAPNYSLFENLQVTVSQVQDMTYQAVNVAWEGSLATPSTDLAADYMQIMQCWDDGTGTADPTHCQWGAGAGSSVSLLGAGAGSRSLGNLRQDPNQSYTGKFDIKPPPGQSSHSYAVPFQTPPTEANPEGETTQRFQKFFDSSTSNEIAGARTSPDGTGEVTFEIQTTMEAPHLGCGGTTVDGEVRDCWLVVVPRGEFMANGVSYTQGLDGRLMGSPLSQTNWNDRIEFPLDFRSVESGCPIGANEVRTTGNEMVTAAFASWQASMCADKKVFGFSMIGDSESRRNLVSETDGAARLAFIDKPLTSTESTGSTLVYAPVAKTALVIAYNINYQMQGDSDLKFKDGQQMTDLTLSPRLVAKLLTQSYQDDVAGGRGLAYLESNPRNLRFDPEFIELNPEIGEFIESVGLTGLMVPIGNEDVFAQLWTWIKADTYANAFLAGTPDEWGMEINPNYRDLGINSDSTINSFPKADLATLQEYWYVPEPGYGTFELRPYVSDLHDGGVRALRGDAGSKTYWDTSRTPAAFASPGIQRLGERFMLTVTDLVTAKRLGLGVAKLLNPQGAAIAPTDTSIDSAIAEFVDSEVAGVKVSTAVLESPDSYPLSTLTYAAIDVCRASIADLKKYKSLLNFVGDEGQSVGNAKGQLPVGYVPIDETQASSVQKAIAAIGNEVSSPSCASHVSEPTVETPVIDIPVPTTDPIVEPDPDVDKSTGKFASDPNSALRYSMLSALFLGIPMIAGGRTLIRKANSL